MKKIMVAGFLMLVAVLNVGYYNYVEEYGPDSTTFFWKKSLTLQVKFVNPYANWGGEYDVLDDEQQQQLIDYCKYRLGIKTNLDHPEDARRCSRL